MLARILVLLALALAHALAQEALLVGVTKPGRCTPMKLDKLSLCVQRYDLCQDDVQCPGDYKCCPRPCGHVCQAPLNGTQASESIRMTAAAARPLSSLAAAAVSQDDLARELMALQYPNKKTIDPYSYYYNQMAKNRHIQELLNQRYSLYPSYSSPNRAQLLNAQRYLPYNNMVMRTKSYSRKPAARKNQRAEKINKLSQRFRRPAVTQAARKSKECDCEKEAATIQKLSSKLNKKVKASQEPVGEETQESQVSRAKVEKLSMTKAAPAYDPLEEALLDQEPKPQEQALFKPGVCPNKFTFGRCLIECYQDSDCQGEKICCHSGCGYSCAMPVNEKRVAGQCPNNKNRIFRCTSPKPLCMRDRDCALDEKCCSIGCQYTCMKV